MSRCPIAPDKGTCQCCEDAHELVKRAERRRVASLALLIFAASTLLSVIARVML